MNLRKLHRVSGLVMLLPLLGWAVTGFVFFLKPGYQEAYELLQLKTYPIEQSFVIKPDPAWLEFRGFKTVLGNHLLVRTPQGWHHLEPLTLLARANPRDEEVEKLLLDAFALNSARYGTIAKINGGMVTTSTGIKVTLDWNRLSLQQRGPDTDRIDRLYKLHYLQWTGVKWLDQLLGLLGLTLLVGLSGLGLLLAFKFKLTSAK